MLPIGSVVEGKYKILNKVGQGGMSVVYLAMNERANKQWAIKEVRKDGVQDYEVVRRGLAVETDMLKRLQHDNLPGIIDVIDNEETFLIVMDYIEGNPLSKTLKEFGAQPQEDVSDGQNSSVMYWVISMAAETTYYLQGYETVECNAETGRKDYVDRFWSRQRVQGHQYRRYELPGDEGVCSSGAVRRQGSDGCQDRYLLSGCDDVSSGDRA